MTFPFKRESESGVQVYDFFAHGIFSEYNGLLGLDFFQDANFCLDLSLNIITIEK